MCECCGRNIVLLRHKTWTEENKHWVACYAKTWDGDPWYRPDNNSSVRMHPRWRWPLWMLEHAPAEKEEKEEDPFFSLDL